MSQANGITLYGSVASVGQHLACYLIQLSLGAVGKGSGYARTAELQTTICFHTLVFRLTRIAIAKVLPLHTTTGSC